MEYGSAVWDPYHQVDIQNLEKIQKRAARFATGNYTQQHGNTNLNMKKLNWTPLEERRAAIKLTLFFKAKHDLVQIPLNHLNSSSLNTRRGNGAYAIPMSNVDSHLYSFYPSAIRLWNGLPDAGKNQLSTESFKNYLDTIVLRSKF